LAQRDRKGTITIAQYPYDFRTAVTPSFQDLMQRLESGDEEAAALLFERYAYRLIGLATRRLDERVRVKVDADDVVNSVMRTFCRRAAERPFHFDGPDDLWALLVEITLRKCGRWNRHFHTRKRDVRREQTPPPLTDSDWDREHLDAGGPHPEDEAVLRETLERLLHGLDDRMRTVCEMRLQGYEIKEIAGALHCTEATIHRKIRHLKDRLKKICPELSD
jgi:RNA polymerase sigma-70 factor, ECF subfamily